MDMQTGELATTRAIAESAFGGIVALATVLAREGLLQNSDVAGLANHLTRPFEKTGGRGELLLPEEARGAYVQYLVDQMAYLRSQMASSQPPSED